MIFLHVHVQYMYMYMSLVHVMLTCSGIRNKESLLVLDTTYHNNTILVDEICAKIKLKINK